VKFLRSPIFWALTAKIKLSPVLDTERDDKGIAVATCTGVLVALGYFLRRSRAMIMTNKLLPVALIAALIGGSVGAVVMHKSQPASAETAVAGDYTAKPAAPVATQHAVADNNEMIPGGFNTAGEQTAYKTGFADGFAAATQAENRTVGATSTTVRRSPQRVVYRNSGSRASSQRVYYDYQPKKRTFWDRHRDKLTVAMGTGAGAAIGGLIGGKKGAAIGALSGAGGSALWTYKLRKRDRNY
jgi:ABC-type Na+ efflux pump permease subunit